MKSKTLTNEGQSHKKKIISKIKKKPRLWLFLAFFCIYFIGGMLISYSYKINENCDFLFQSDGIRIFNSYSQVLGSHLRCTIHPLLVLIAQPIVLILKTVFVNDVLAVVAFSSIVSACNVVLIYSFGCLFNKSKKLNLLIATIFGFSFSAIVFSAGIELYNVAALSLIALWYFIAKVFVNKEDMMSQKNTILLYLLGLFTISVTITNFVVFLIACFILLLSKKINLKRAISINILIVWTCLLLSVGQKIIWNNTDIFLFSNDNLQEETLYMEKSIGLQNFKNVVSDDYFNSIIGSNLTVKSEQGSYVVSFMSIKLITFLVMASFFILLFVLVVKNFKKHLYVNLGLILTLGFNSLLHLVYGNSSPFLYALHFVYLFFMLLVVNYHTNSKHIYVYLTLFCIYEVINNLFIFKRLLELVNAYIPASFYGSSFSVTARLIIYLLVLILTVLLLFNIYIFIKKLMKSRKIKNDGLSIKYIIVIVLSAVSLMGTYITLETVQHYQKFLGFNLDSLKNKNNHAIDTLHIYYPQEIKAYNNLKKEHKDLIEQYHLETTNVLTKDVYYFFGFGNRKKIVYINGKLIDPSNNNVIRDFGKVEDQLVVPNIYTVLLKDVDSNYYKIYEDDQGVHIAYLEKDEIIDGTALSISLYNFSNEKAYREVMKTLYGEILFNIKDSKIIPNILVYDKPFYRDAAYGAMVLKNTNNLDLISNWITNETAIYDLANNDVKELDNLGEMLYMLSLFPNQNQSLIDSIQHEALISVSHNEDNKNYLMGLTDGSYQPGYQNAWYQLGMKKLGLNNSFDRKIPFNGYDNLVWWNKKLCSVDIEDSISFNYPYLDWAIKHCNQSHSSVINASLYPLSFEMNATEGHYENMKILNNYYVNNKIAPTHVWTASEMLLFLLDEAGHLEI